MKKVVYTLVYKKKMSQQIKQDFSSISSLVNKSLTFIHIFQRIGIITFYNKVLKMIHSKVRQDRITGKYDLQVEFLNFQIKKGEIISSSCEENWAKVCNYWYIEQESLY